MAPSSHGRTDRSRQIAMPLALASARAAPGLSGDAFPRRKLLVSQHLGWLSKAAFVSPDAARPGAPRQCRASNSSAVAGAVGSAPSVGSSGSTPRSRPAQSASVRNSYRDANSVRLPVIPSPGPANRYAASPNTAPNAAPSTMPPNNMDSTAPKLPAPKLPAVKMAANAATSAPSHAPPTVPYP